MSLRDKITSFPLAQANYAPLNATQTDPKICTLKSFAVS